MTLSNSVIISFFQKYWILIAILILVIIAIVAYNKGKNKNKANSDIYNYRWNQASNNIQ